MLNNTYPGPIGPIGPIGPKNIRMIVISNLQKKWL